MVTSRVSIANATILSLEALKEKSAIHLARTYLAKRGGSPLDENTYSDLTKSCFYNPLAIRLTIDLIIAGRDVPSSINVANKEIAEFSYNNLIDTLSDSAIEILEAVFVEDNSTRTSLCELLSKDLDDISSAVGELSRTSLISRNSNEQGESYSLCDSVRDLLVISPRNIKARTRVQDSLHKRRLLSKEIDIKQDKMDLPAWHADYIPKDANENLKILVTEVNRSLGKAKRNTDIAVSLFRKLKETSFIYNNEYLYHKAFARVLEVLNDLKGAEDHFKLAIQYNEKDPSSTYLLARLLHDTKRYDEAYIQYDNLINSGWIKNGSENESFGKTIYNGYFLALLFGGKYDEIIDLTKKWKESGIYRGILGTYRASAIKRKVEHLVNDDPENAVDGLIRASRILSDVFRNDGYFKSACTQASNLFDEIYYCFSRPEYSLNHEEQGRELLNFIASNVLEISQGLNGFDTDILVNKFSKIDISNNPFKSKSWKCLSNIYSNDDYHEETNSQSNGLISVKISNRPKDNVRYFFAKDAFGHDYFLHFDNFKNGGWRDWVQLSIGMMLDIVADNLKGNKEPNNAINAKEIYLRV